MSLAGDLAASIDPAAMATAVNHPPEPWQRRLLQSTSKRVLVVAARQTGKSVMISLIALHRATYWPGSLIPIISSRLDAAAEFVLRIRTWARMLGVAVEGESVTTLRFGNGSRVLALPSTMDTVRGYSAASLIIVDEASFVPDPVFHAVVPSLAANGRLIALSTPAGPVGWLYDAWQQPGGVWEKHHVRASESAQYSPERLEENRRLLGEYAYMREIEAEFSDPEGAFFRGALVDAALTDIPTLFPNISRRSVA